MNILVCLKIQPDPENILLEDYKKFERNIDLSYAGLEFNCFDTSGLEIGLKLKEQMTVQGVETSCTVFSVGKKFPPNFAESLYAIGYDDVVFMEIDQLEFQPENVSECISIFAKDYMPDFIIMGKEASYAETGMVPYIVSNLIDYNIINEVERCEYSLDEVVAYFRENNNLCKKTIHNRTIICVGNSPEVLRVSTLRQRLLFRGKKPSIFKNKANFGVDNDILSFELVDNDRHCKMLDMDKDEDLKFVIKLLNNNLNESKIDLNNNVYIKFKDKCMYFKTRNNKKLLFNDLLFKVKEQKPSLVVLEDTPENRLLSIELSKELNTKVLFGSSLIDINNTDITVKKYVMGSNLSWYKKLPLGSIILVNKNELPSNMNTIYVDSISNDDNDSILVESYDESRIEDANVIIACGNGLGNKEYVDKARVLSKSLDAGFGLTRPSALNAWGKPNEIIGQSGYKLSPNVSLCLGVAGAAAFMVGINKSNTIIAVNTDKDALIFKQADYGFVMDAQIFLDKMLEYIK